MDEKRIVIERWLQKAKRDLQSARLLLEANPPPTDIVCFHCQQCVEKYLKAFLVSREQDIPRTHDLQRLHRISFEKIETPCIELSDYAVEVRYVDDWREIPIEEAKTALQHAETAVYFITDFFEI